MFESENCHKVVANMRFAIPLFVPVFASFLYLQPFGDIWEIFLGRIRPNTINYLVLSAVSSFLIALLLNSGRKYMALFYFFMLCALIYLEKYNFGELGLVSAFKLLEYIVVIFLFEELIKWYLLPRLKILSIAFSMFYQFIIFSIIYILIAYNYGLESRVDEEFFFAIFQTNIAEAVEFVGEFIPRVFFVVFLGGVVLFCFLNFRSYGNKNRLSFWFILSLGAISCSHLTIAAEGPKLVPLSRQSFVKYVTEVKRFRDLCEQRNAGIINFKAKKEGSGETYVVVIGESQNRNHMSAYGYFRDTTPWLIEKAKDPNTIVFNNAFSSHTYTMLVLSQSLTQASQYNNRDYLESASLVDIANKAGFNTYWISNQVQYGEWDNLVSVIADQSDVRESLNKNIGKTTSTEKYDEITSFLLKKTLKKIDFTSNNLIIVHLMGNHAVYNERYPEEFNIFKDSNDFEFGQINAKPHFTGRMNSYDNSILYNDHVVSQLFLECGKFDSIAGIIYFADHADSVASGAAHNLGSFRHDMTHIPMYAWFSDNYIAANPGRFNCFKGRVDTVFTNDLIYDTLIGLMGIDTELYNPGQDFSASEYSIEPEEARTLHGKKLISEDPYVQQYNFKKNFAGNRVIAHRVNTLGKLSDANRLGFTGVELDLVFQLGGGEGWFEVGHDSDHLTGGRLEEYLQHVTMGDESKLWLDIKNLNGLNYVQALEQLELLSTCYSKLKSSAIIESGSHESWFSVFSKNGWHTSYYLPTDRILDLMQSEARSEKIQFASAIARQIFSQKTSAVSFDSRLYPFVKTYLEEQIRGSLDYHLWDLSVTPWMPRSEGVLRGKDYFSDERVKTIIVPIQSEYFI